METVIIFGATTYFYQIAVRVLKEDIEIVALSDNDSSKWNISYKNINVINPEMIKTMQFDYILIGPLFSYETINMQLRDMGVDENKILPLVDSREIKWLSSRIDFNERDVVKIYKKGRDIVKLLGEANRVNANYDNIATFEEDDQFTDFSKYPLIAHACGGFINGEEKEYTNSLEAFRESLMNNFKMIEVDVWGEKNGNIIMGSRLKMQYPVDIDYTIPTLNQLLDLICDDESKKIILDIKWNTVEDFSRMLGKIEDVVLLYQDRGHINIKRQVLIEVFDEETSSIASQGGWECLLTDYRAKDGSWIKKVSVICSKYNIHTIMIDTLVNNTHEKYIRYALNKNINVLCYTVDDLTVLAKYKKLGCISCLTNYLKIGEGRC